MIRLASAIISFMLLSSRSTGLFDHGAVEPGEKLDALPPFPKGQISILYPIWSIALIIRVCVLGLILTIAWAQHIFQQCGFWVVS